MSTLHIVQGGVDNGDKAWIEKAARQKLSTKGWIAPKSAIIGDEVIIFVTGHGFFATARIMSKPKKRSDWVNRYGAGLDSIRLIKPAIPLATIQQEIPELIWANYPRSITTPAPEVADRIRTLITSLKRKRQKSILTIESTPEEFLGLEGESLQRMITHRKREYKLRDAKIADELKRANGHLVCEVPDCGFDFLNVYGEIGDGYAQVHHLRPLADYDGEEVTRLVDLVIVCANCHAMIHRGGQCRELHEIIRGS